MKDFRKVSKNEFIEALKFVQENYKVIRDNTTAWNEIKDDTASYYLSGNPAFMGFAVSLSGELTSVFSAIKGNGDKILSNAVILGANNLDCFDGYLVSFYERHGFKEVRREANWTAGAADVVFMER